MTTQRPLTVNMGLVIALSIPAGAWAHSAAPGEHRVDLHVGNDYDSCYFDLHPELLAAVGDFVPALEPYAGALRHRLVTAADPPALAPLLARHLRGDELVVLKASRGVALERILPALQARAKHPNPPGAPLHPR